MSDDAIALARIYTRLGYGPPMIAKFLEANKYRFSNDDVVAVWRDELVRIKR